MKFIAGLFGSAIGLTFGLLMLFSLPLNVIALMHFYGWEWWSALIAAILMNCIPFIGQLAYLVFAIIGAYFLLQAGFDWRKAVAATPETYNIATLSNEKFEQFKTSVIRPQIKQGCVAEARQRVSFEGKIPENALKFCDCYAGVVVDVVSREELIAQEADQGVLPEFKRKLAVATQARCGNL